LAANLENLPLITVVELKPKMFTFKRHKIAGMNGCMKIHWGYGTGEL
jgi:hypothetical protein